MKRFFSGKIVLIIIMALFLGFADLPSSAQKSILPFAPDFLTNAKVHLGLDLQGGSQLDYKINLEKVPEQDREDIIDGVFEVINKRVNSLGVSEPNIYRSSIANEEHIIVELAGIKDLEQAKKTVGKTIQLEFKEPKEEADPGEIERIKAQAQEALNKIKGGEDFAIVGTEYAQNNAGKVTYSEDDKFYATDSIGKNVSEAIAGIQPGEFVPKLIENDSAYRLDAQGQLVPDSSLLIVKLLERQESTKYEKEVNVSHILITYKDSQGANSETTFTKEEAKAKADDIRREALSKDFAKLVEAHSDDGNTLETGGKIEESINDSPAVPLYGEKFKEASLNLEKEGDISEVVESDYGFHIIKADKVATDVKQIEVKLARVNFSTIPDQWQATGLTGEHFVHADFQIDQLGQAYVSIIFNDEGAELFEEITGKLAPQRKRLAIFVGGELISAPSVNSRIAGGEAQITGNFTFEEAKELARDLNTGAIPAPIILTGQNTVGATLGAASLQQSLWAGIIGLIALALYMIFSYRLPGVIAVIALAIYSMLLLFLIKVEMHAAIAILLSIAIFFFIVRAILNSKDSGLEKMLSLMVSVFVLFFFTFLFKTPVVLTLAGVAGVILSIGMAVDANILIFERMKEELREGHSIKASIENGFERAWSSIRDSNFSSLITCAILFYFGSSIIRGFALNLAAGILISMFSAITLTKTFLLTTGKTKLAEKKWLFGIAKKKEPYKIIEKSKLWFGFSGILIALSIFFLSANGIKLGIDFTGGTFMEVKFENEVNKEELTNAFVEIEKGINNGEIEVGENTPEDVNTLSQESSLIETAQAQNDDASINEANNETSLEAVEIDLATAQIVSGGEENQFFIKTKFIDSAEHDTLIRELQNKFGNLTEPRYTAVGPVVGKTLKSKAIVALIITLLMIILYIAFAFRKVPKEVNPWRFGICAILALIHDVLITVGVFSLLGSLLGVEIDALFITALLTILGFSVHDTIVVFDRVRENLKYQDSKDDLTATTNKALTETMARSINTSVSTLITLVALLIWGSPSIFYFVLALVIGVIAGTYSSIFTASPILVAWSKWRSK